MDVKAMPTAVLRAVLTTSLVCGAISCTGAVGPVAEGLDPGRADSGQTSLADGGPSDEPEPTADAGDPPDGGVDPDAGTPLDAGQPVTDGGRDFSTDRSRFFGDSRCAQADVLLCEDFEGASLDQSTWSIVGTAPVLDDLQAARGSKALHITRTGSGASYLRATKSFPLANNTYYGRMFVYFKSLPSPPALSYAHWTIAAASGTGTSGEIRIGGQLFSGKNWFGVGTDSQGSPTGTGDWTNSDRDPNDDPRAVPLNEWICLEWMHQGNTNETRFYWDGVEHPSLYTSSTVHGGNNQPYILPTFRELWIGWDLYQGSAQTFEMWIDEVAIDTRRIGCVL